MPPAIRVENLGKQYMLGEFERYSTLRETLARAVTRPAARLARHLRQVIRPKRSGFDPPPSAVGSSPSASDSPPCALGSSPEFIWALRDVSFEVQHGEVLGIIGRNGAGKSTLLKILSRITEPTTGYAEIRGRVGSLLEVGTGFHPELTGRENVYLNGAILGMSKAEIRRKFDDIVSFAGVEKFIDTPVKRYSSGMQVRLAFAVAAHLDPEILIIDEVLAVGDAEFQKRCLGKMNEVSRSGRTVLFVSHNMAAVEGLCTRAVLLDEGRIRRNGSTSSVLNAYFQASRAAIAFSNAELPHSIASLAVVDSDGKPVSGVPLGGDLTFRIQFRTANPITTPRVAIRVFTLGGQRVLTCHTDYHYPNHYQIEDGTSITCTVRDCRLTPGVYTVELQLDDRSHILCRLPNTIAFEVYPRDLYGTHRQLPNHAAIWHPDISWQVDTSPVPS